MRGREAAFIARDWTTHSQSFPQSLLWSRCCVLAVRCCIANRPKQELNRTMTISFVTDQRDVWAQGSRPYWGWVSCSYNQEEAGIGGVPKTIHSMCLEPGLGGTQTTGALRHLVLPLWSLHVAALVRRWVARVLTGQLKALRASVPRETSGMGRSFLTQPWLSYGILLAAFSFSKVVTKSIQNFQRDET